MIYAFDGKIPQIHESAFVSENAVIIGDVTLGPNCYVGPGATIRSDFFPIRIGAECVIEDGVILHAGGRGNGMVIGDRVVIGHGAFVHSLRIGNNVGIGMGAVVSLNTELGEGCIVAEGAMVRQGQQVPAGVLVGGVPAKELREVTEKDRITWQKNTEWYMALARKLKDPTCYYRVDVPTEKE
ncbi:MAG: gamma carbonic anhydrase family protein [Oscillospiraceae bacterium]|nr:gamma carbonic anhydrase family protein [Oscillospiraceae bacterium]